MSALAPAHAALLAEHQLQFHFIKPPPPKPPGWLTLVLADLAKVLGPIAPFLFWATAALAILGLLVFLSRAWLHRRRTPARRRGEPLHEAVETWRPSAKQASALLAEADDLARRELYAEAVHLILLRSIEDIRALRPNMVRPALTSRDISKLSGLPPAARETFAGIAQAVERSLFGGSAVDQSEFSMWRRAYETFVVADARS